MRNYTPHPLGLRREYYWVNLEGGGGGIRALAKSLPHRHDDARRRSYLSCLAAVDQLVGAIAPGS